jgi:hypothetical protein
MVMGAETVQIWSGDAAEASYYRVAHLLVSALWDRGAGDRTLTALTNLFAEVTHGPGGRGAAADPIAGGEDVGTGTVRPGNIRE